MVSMSRFAQVPDDIKYVIRVPAERSKQDDIRMISDRIIYEVENNDVVDVAIVLATKEVWVFTFDDGFCAMHYDEKSVALEKHLESIIHLEYEDDTSEETPKIDYGIFTKIQNFFVGLVTKNVPLPELREVEEPVRDIEEVDTTIPEALEELEVLEEVEDE